MQKCADQFWDALNKGKNLQETLLTQMDPLCRNSESVDVLRAPTAPIYMEKRFVCVEES